MTIEAMKLVTIISVLFGIINIIYNISHSNSKEDKEAGAQMAEIMVELRNINNGVGEIKGRIASLDEKFLNLTERIVILEANYKAIWKYIDEDKVSNKD